jgi:type I restriction enzyme M protein
MPRSLNRVIFCSSQQEMSAIFAPPMLTGEIRNQIDRIWDAFWAGGIANPLEVIEQITYLLFIRRLDDLHTLEENKANRLKKPLERRVFPQGKDNRGRP